MLKIVLKINIFLFTRKIFCIAFETQTKSRFRTRCYNGVINADALDVSRVIRFVHVRFRTRVTYCHGRACFGKNPRKIDFSGTVGWVGLGQTESRARRLIIRGPAAVNGFNVRTRGVKRVTALWTARARPVNIIEIKYYAAA